MVNHENNFIKSSICESHFALRSMGSNDLIIECIDSKINDSYKSIVSEADASLSPREFQPDASSAAVLDKMDITNGDSTKVRQANKVATV